MKKREWKVPMWQMVQVFERIKQLQDDRGWSDSEMARRIGIHKGTVSSWYESGMMLDTFLRLCNAFNISPGQFFEADREELAKTRILDSWDQMEPRDRCLYEKIGEDIVECREKK